MHLRRILLLPIDQNLGRPFPEQDEIRDGESGAGYGLRMACRNGVSFSELAEIVESPGHRYLSARSVKYVAYLFGASPDALARATPVLARDQGRDVVIFHETMFTRPYLLRHAWPRLCPICLLEEGVARSYWEISIATACWKHRTRLVDECGFCGRRISWRRPGMLDCFCGANYVDQVIDVEDEIELGLCAYFEEKLTRSEPGTALHHPLFNQLSLNSLLRLIWSLGIVSLMPCGKPIPGKVTRAPDVTSAVRLVYSAVESLKASPTQRAPLWLGSELAQELTSEELETVCSFIPELATLDGHVRKIPAQLHLSLGDSEAVR